jgi:hypothetical protein
MRRLLVVLALLAGVSLIGGMPRAVADDGVTEVCRFTDERFTELSGMTMSLRHPGVLWLHNDSSGGPRIYAVDATTCRTLATITIAGIEARDIEAIASGRDRRGRPVLWIADFGDNRDNWPEVRLVRIREPAALTDQTVTARTYRFTYSDRPHNAEALLADPHSSRLWVVTKQLAHGSLYALPRHLSRSTVNVARKVRIEGGMVTDGAVSPDGSRYVLRDYVDAFIYTGLPPGRQQQRVYLPFQLQGEAITWTPDGSALLIAGERDDRLLRVEVPVPGGGAPASGAGAAAPSASASSSAAPTAGASASGEGGGQPVASGSGAAGTAVAVGLVAAAGLVIASAEVRRRRARGG